MTTPRIKSLIRRDDTILRLGGIGDNYHMSWAADDTQVVSVCDGHGWAPDRKAIYNSRLWRITGSPPDVKFHDTPTYPDLISKLGVPLENMRYYNFGTLALDDRIYQYMSTPNHIFPEPGAKFVGAKLVYSPDNGRTWHNQDGSTPVRWEGWDDRSRQNMLFFEEEEDAFSLFSVLQMGRNYEANRDGYIYLYSPNGSTDGTMNKVVMMRVPKDALLDRSAYECFAGLQPDGSARWTKSIAGRAVVQSFPEGWVNSKMHPWAWMPSVVYNAPLGIYMMTSWGNPPSPEGMWFHRPSYLGFWTAPNPWGPWTQIHEETAWTPGNDPKSRAFAPQISPKWISEDGKSFWLVWSDFQGDMPADQVAHIRSLEDPKEAARLFAKLADQYMPYYAFNAQRVDIVLA